MRKLFILVSIAVMTGFFPLYAQQKGTGHKTFTSKHSTQKGGKQTSQKKSGTTAQGKNGKQQPAEAKAGMIPEAQLDSIRQQVTPLVKFFESSLNFLADPRNDVSEKQVIITQSYLKWCWDSNVQIEDDLDEARLVPLRKDVSAYLTDVSFFFRSAKFLFTVQDVSLEHGDGGLTYFKVTTNRNLKGILLTGDSINSNKVRYFEMNYDSLKQQLKIVSVYTTKMNEKDDMRNWWNALSKEWKAALAGDRKLEGTMPMGDIENFNDSVAIVGGKKTFIMGSQFYTFLGEIIHREQLDISGLSGITSLEPLSRLSNLKELKAANLPVSDLMPLRNLNKLVKLDLTGTGVETLDPLKFCNSIAELKLRGAPVEDISLVASFPAMSLLDIRYTRVLNTEPLKELTQMHDLRLGHTRIADLAPISGLTAIEMLDLSVTRVTTLDPLSGMSALKIIQFDSTDISSLAPLDKLSQLQRIYCNNSLVNRKTALAYLKVHPDVQLIYDTKGLTNWWKGMSPEWQTVFNFYQKFDGQPNPEQLHRLALLDSINIAGRMGITSLDPLDRLILLRSLSCQSTGITNLGPLKELTEIRTLNASNTKISDVEALSAVVALEVLNIDNTQVTKLDPLYGLNKLTFVYADNTKVDDAEARKFSEAVPGCLLVYQTFENTDWWGRLSSAWKEVLLGLAGLKGDPDKVGLQRIASLKKVTITDNFQISDLSPMLHLDRLEELTFSGTNVTTLDPVAGMKRLRVLGCQRNPLTALTAVSGLSTLKELDFSNTQVEDLDALQNMVQLEVLKFNGTQVKNLKYLQLLTNLTTLEFFNTRVGNIDVLDGMNKLKVVKMFNTRVSAKRVEKLRALRPGCEIVYY